MAPYYLWFALAAVLVIAELASATLYLLMVAIGATAAGLAALGGFGADLQILVAALVALAGFVLLRRSRYGRIRRGEAASDPSVNLDIGQELDVPAWDAHRRARVPYRGADWDVELRPGAEPVPGRYRIVEIRGSTLYVQPR
jgi:membrane protein implicated in regulation of membrane protease activity